MSVARKAITLITLVLILAIASSKTVVHLLTEVWWFSAVQFDSVFWTRITWKLLLWCASFAAYTAFLWGNYRLAMRNAQSHQWALLETKERQLNAGADLFSNLVATGLIFLTALTAAVASLPAWETVLKFLHATSFGSKDPIFDRDIGFYLFQLPLYESLHQWLLGMVVLAIALVALVYLLKGMIVSNQRYRVEISDRAKSHLNVLLGLLFLMVAWGFWLARYHLLYSSGKAFFGAGYTDVHARLLAYLVMSLLAVGVAILFFIALFRRRFRLPVRGVALFVLAFVLLKIMYPWFMQQFIVNPNELSKEKPYIEHNIRFTQAAYHLADVQQENYSAISQLTRQSLQSEQPTIRNIRLWDYRPLLSTYRQLQEIRLYYKFSDVDVDRYTFDQIYQQVMLSARELAFSQLPKEAQTWVNQRLKYTHGYGLVMSPVNRVAADGLPELFVKDIPPVSSVDLSIQRPAIYYGEETENYIFTGTSTDEFDYASGNANVMTRYSGIGGVAMPSAWHRLAYAYDLGSIQILISNYFTNQSRIHYYRQIQERVKHIAPFLRFDPDPYLTVVDGKLQWILDGYTVSDRYPYSYPINQVLTTDKALPAASETAINGRKINYIRNSVKVVVDAYDGSLRFFVVDETDPVLKTYRKIFPQLFEPKTTIPSNLKAHFRYPEGLFKIQAQMYLAYHMSDPEVFYNREDLWSLPKQTYEGNEVVMEPYYVIMRLPKEVNSGFILIQPFTPANKDNMIAWMAARSNGEDYGKLLLYSFPKHTLVYGPRQIEARIDQDPQISQQFTLWSQAGSKVIRGDLLVIPIDQSLLYVEPVYLRAEQGELPELKRVIVAYDKAVVMEESLEQSLNAIFGVKPAATMPPPVGTEDLSTLRRSALELYQKSQAALRQGDWSAYGRYQKELERVLQKLSE
ncbi:MAG TPA: UPF0182 family protein [Leptolyngbyaceae cyanobacterium M33_DOE_097]|uniref:UPF0182 protein ENR64_15275 n=1 Tax=Oscillatoriales cyanobacterium SpSt-418 TaxID=2282169 RepID=A0A7C3KG18_9CYAN|nr:UPF0182 family protein [Leptolyngbyaceae cyanobacterium M33_DOE_097]